MGIMSTIPIATTNTSYSTEPNKSVMSTSVEEKVVAMTMLWWAPVMEHLSGVKIRHVVDSDEIRAIERHLYKIYMDE